MRGRARFFSVCGAALLMAGAAHAQSASAPKADPEESFARQLRLTSKTVRPADFVTASRPPADQMRFLPTQGPRPEPLGPALLTPEQIHAKEAELDALLARHNAVGRRAPTRYAVNSAAGRPLAKKGKKTQRCLITCVVAPPGSKS